MSQLWELAGSLLFSFLKWRISRLRPYRQSQEQIWPSRWILILYFWITSDLLHSLLHAKAKEPDMQTKQMTNPSSWVFLRSAQARGQAFQLCRRAHIRAHPAPWLLHKTKQQASTSSQPAHQSHLAASFASSQQFGTTFERIYGLLSLSGALSLRHSWGTCRWCQLGKTRSEPLGTILF